MRRRLAAVTLGVGALLLGLAPSSSAAPADWEGSRFTSAASSASSRTPLEAVFVRSYGAPLTTYQLVANLTVQPPAGLPAGCTTTVEGGDWNNLTKQPDNRHVKSGVLVATCNGSYTVSSKAQLERRVCLPTCRWVIDDTHTVTQTVSVAELPPDVDASVAPGSGRSLVVSWSAPGSVPADFLGYRVQQLSSDGWATLADLGPDATSYTHEDPGADGSTVEYRVLARRSGPGGTEVTSTGGQTAGYEMPTPTDPGGPTGPGDPGGSGGPGDPTTPTTGSTPPDLGDLGTPTAPGRPGGGSRVQAPRLGITGTFLPPLLRPSAADIRSSTTTTLDTGYDDNLPYDVEPGEDDPVLPDDEMAAFFDGAAPGRGMAIPVATALVLAVWAFHLRTLARMARPVDEA